MHQQPAERPVDRPATGSGSGGRGSQAGTGASGVHPAAVAETMSPYIDAVLPELHTIRRDIHRNPELAWQEVRTTKTLADRLTAAGLHPRSLGRTGLWVDIDGSDIDATEPADSDRPGSTGSRSAGSGSTGSGSAGPGEQPRLRIGLRADLDALPLQERTGLAYASRNAGVSHACGHDVHTTSLLGAGLVLAAHRDLLAAAGVGVRLIFQPAEEVMPGGGEVLRGTPCLQGLDSIYALHCDPRRDVGTIGLRDGAITAAGDSLTVTLSGRGGHSSRPHLTADITYALARVLTELPGALSRRLDPRCAASLVWGSIHAGTVPNVIPESGTISGTLRTLDAAAWEGLEPLVTQLVREIAAPYGAHVDVDYHRGVPPVVNDPACVTSLATAAHAALGPDSVGVTEQSLGGEDFAWLLQDVRGALARLGTRTPGGLTHDLHQGDLVVDERAIGVAVRLLTVLPFARVAQAV